MTQRNPMNERYNDENRGGKTRKSAASAKPATARAATVRTPSPKTKKQKQAEARERERKQEQRYQAVASSQRIEDLPEYKKLRRIWWVCLIAAIVCIAISFASSSNDEMGFLYIPFLVAGYVLVIAAFYIDLGRVRKLRKKYEQQVVQGKSKEARAAQKAARAEARAQQKEAEEKFEAAQAEEQAKKEAGFLGRFRKKAPEEGSEDK